MRTFAYISALLTTALGLAAFWIAYPTATPIKELLPEHASIDLEAYEGSMPSGSGSPEILILGSSHLAQMDHDFQQGEFDRVINALSEFDPDLMAIEYLPAEYPRGKGRDYRPTFDTDMHANRWEMNAEEADSLISANRTAEGLPENPCELGKAYFLAGDYLNAPYFWLQNDCPEVREHDEIDRWLSNRSAHEMAEIGFPVAQNSELDQLVAFDYQGDDAEWFIFDEGLDALRSGRVWVLSNFWPILPQIGTTSRERRARPYDESLLSMLHLSNSPEHIGLQYWVYEDVVRSITWQGEEIGSRQTDNYWLRNERMFDYLQEAINEQEPERVLVITGSGHKYFLDELAVEAGYRWIDPREWLPDPS